MIDKTTAPDQDQALAQGLRDEAGLVGRLHADPLMARVLAARAVAAPSQGQGRHAWLAWRLEPGGGVRLAGAALLLTAGIVSCTLWLHRPAPAVLPTVDVLSQMSLGGL